MNQEQGRCKKCSRNINRDTLQKALILKFHLIFMWETVDGMLEPKDYLQVFRLTEQNSLQVIRHTAKQPEYEMTYILPTMTKAVTAKIYIIDDGENCVMLLAEEY